MDTRIAGGVLLIVGTAIGAGMLALPTVTVTSGYWASSLMMVACWALMTISAFLMLEVNLWLPPRNNLITMARSTLGKPGEIIAWLSFLLLLYALLSAYIAGGSDLFHSLTGILGFKTARWLDAALFVLIFGAIVFKGITPVDYVNRLLMITKLGSLFLIMFFTLPYVDVGKLTQGHSLSVFSTVTVMVTSFGFANIVPSLRSYLNHDIRKLRLAILIGSLIPLVCYLFWDAVILGTLPHEGDPSLTQIMQTGGSIAELTQLLSAFLHNSSIIAVAHVFTTICVLTSFLCVALSLSDFLSDGLSIEKKGRGNWIINAIVFLPPLMIVVFDPSIFIQALNYAGMFCIILLVFLPVCMVWSGRYYKKIATSASFRVFGGRGFLAVVMVAGAGIIFFGL